MYYEFLKLIVEHVIDETNDETVIAAHAKIKKGESQVDTLHDIIAMTKVLREHQDVAITYTPCGIVANEGYLDLVSKEAQELLEKIGVPVKATVNALIW